MQLPKMKLYLFQHCVRKVWDTSRLSAPSLLPLWALLLWQDAPCHLSSWLQAADVIFWLSLCCPAEQPLAMSQLCRCGTLAVGFEGLPTESHNTSLRVTSRPGAHPDTDSMTPALKQQRTAPNDLSYSRCHISAARSWLQRQLHKHSSDTINILGKWLQKICTDVIGFFFWTVYENTWDQLWCFILFTDCVLLKWRRKMMVMFSA